MAHSSLDRNKLRIRPLCERENRAFIERDRILPDARPRRLEGRTKRVIGEALERIRTARKNRRSVMMAFGAHSIKNGLAPVFISLMEDGWLTHLATNGAGVIHDWEFAFQGESSENVAENVARGQFGLWQETGFYINLALRVGAYEGLGYGESVGAMIENEGLQIPAPAELLKAAREPVRTQDECDKGAGALDLLGALRQFKLKPGFMAIPHPFRKYSVQAAAYRLGIPFTAHPMIGHDIIYTHPMNCCAAVGRTAQRDFLTYAANVNNLERGVYLSVGSAVMSPMIFEKSLSMSQNLQIQRGKRIRNHYILVADLAKADWDWSGKGEPPREHPAYYLRYCKSFSRMGGAMRYLSADNRDILLWLAQGLGKRFLISRRSNA